MSYTSQTITFSALSSQLYSLNGVITLSATSDSGLAVSYSSSDSNVVEVSGSTLIIKGAGSATITASQSGDNNYNPATSVHQTQTITKANQTITFSPLSSQPYSPTGLTLLSANSDSGLAISYSSSDLNVVQVSGSTLNVIGAGSATITASQPGNNNYNPATPVEQTQTITKANHTITFSPLSSRIYSPNAVITLLATASSGLAVSYLTNDNLNTIVQVLGNTLIMKGAGTTTIIASHSGDNNYNPAVSVEQIQTITKANQTITFNVLPPTKFVPNGLITLLATASSGLPVSYTSNPTTVVQVSGNTLIMKKTGTTTITASQPGNNNYNPATSVNQTQQITRITSIIIQFVTDNLQLPST